jgi:hypothetical protein
MLDRVGDGLDASSISNPGRRAARLMARGLLDNGENAVKSPGSVTSNFTKRLPLSNSQLIRGSRDMSALLGAGKGDEKVGLWTLDRR